MSDIQDEDFSKELAAAFEADEKVVENPTAPAAENAATPEETPTPAKTEDSKKDEAKNPEDPAKEVEETPAPAANPETQAPQETQAPETQAPEPTGSTPLTEEGVRKLLNEARMEERNSTQVVQTATQEVLDSYYPDGLSNVLVDQNSGKELRTPQDVVDAAGGDMSMEEAARWLMNEQYKLDQSVEGIKKQAEQIAETTLNFKRDSTAAVQKYQPLFEAYPQLQEKAYKLMIRQVKFDEKKGVVLQAPDVMELYDDYLEPYQKAYEYSTQQSATNPVAQETPAPAKPGINDRLDEPGDGGANTVVDDPNDFAQQVNKELAKGI